MAGVFWMRGYHKQPAGAAGRRQGAGAAKGGGNSKQRVVCIYAGADLETWVLFGPFVQGRQ
jgi:hypothetical protein